MKLLFHAIACLAAMPALLPVFAQDFCFEEAGSGYGLSPSLLKSIASIESGMNPAAMNRNRNGTVDLGLMQINSYWITASRLDRELLMGDACYNTWAGARILRGCIDRYGYTWEAVGCYNANSDGKRRSYAWKVYRQLAADEKGKSGAAPKGQLSAGSMNRGKRDNASLTFSIVSQEPETHKLP